MIAPAAAISFYMNIIICLLIMILSSIIFIRLIYFLKSRTSAPAKTPLPLLALALVWLGIAIDMLFITLSLMVNGLMLDGQTFNPIFVQIALHGLILFGNAQAFYIAYQFSNSRRTAFILTGLFSLNSLALSLFIIFSGWDTAISSDWGPDLVIPKTARILSSILGGLLLISALAGSVWQLFKYLKNKLTLNFYNFIIDLSVVIFLVGGILDIMGSPGWRMVFDRSLALVAPMMIFIIISQTDYLNLVSGKSIKQASS